MNDDEQREWNKALLGRLDGLIYVLAFIGIVLLFGSLNSCMGTTRVRVSNAWEMR